MALRFMQRLDPGERMPLCYGFAWFTDWSRTHAVCMPVPFNVVARVLRDAWHYMASIGYEVPVSPRAAYLAGRRDGRMAVFNDMASIGIECDRRTCAKDMEGESCN